jgi:hypothetical protein
MTETKKNILLFRGDNKINIKTTLQKWREKFVEKYGEMNLAEIRNDNISDGILGDCMALGFM